MQNSIARTKGAIERKKRELEVMEAVSDALPAGIPEPKLVVVFALWSSKASVHWQLETVDDIFPLLEAFPPNEARYYAKSGTLAFKPQSALEEREETHPVEPIVLKLEPNKRGYPLFESGLVFDWFALLGDVPVSIKVSFKDSCVKESWPVISTWTIGRGNSERSAQALIPGVLFDSLHKKVQWASGDRLTPSEYTVYWPCEEATTDCTLSRQFIQSLR